MKIYSSLKGGRPVWHFQSTLALSVFLILSSNAVAQVVSVSADKFAQYDVNEAYWEVVVECSSSLQPRRTIRQNHNESKWCSKEFSSVCSQDKQSAAELICGVDYNARLETQNLQRLQKQKELADTKRKEAQAQEKRREEVRVQELATAQERQRNELLRQQASTKKPTVINAVARGQAIAEAEDQLIDIEQQLLQIQTAQLRNRKKLRAIRKELSTR